MGGTRILVQTGILLTRKSVLKAGQPPQPNPSNNDVFLKAQLNQMGRSVQSDFPVTRQISLTRGYFPGDRVILLGGGPFKPNRSNSGAERESDFPVANKVSLSPGYFPSGREILPAGNPFEPNGSNRGA